MLQCQVVGSGNIIFYTRNTSRVRSSRYLRYEYDSLHDCVGAVRPSRMSSRPCHSAILAPEAGLRDCVHDSLPISSFLSANTVDFALAWDVELFKKHCFGYALNLRRGITSVSAHAELNCLTGFALKQSVPSAVLATFEARWLRLRSQASTCGKKCRSILQKPVEPRPTTTGRGLIL